MSTPVADKIQVQPYFVVATLIFWTEAKGVAENCVRVFDEATDIGLGGGLAKVPHGPFSNGRADVTANRTATAAAQLKLSDLFFDCHFFGGTHWTDYCVDM